MSQNIDVAVGVTVKVGSTTASNVTNVSLPKYKVDEKEVTNMSHTDRFKRFIPGLVDAGELGLDVLLDSDALIAYEALLTTTVLQTVTLTAPTTPSSTVVVCSGFINSLEAAEAKVGDLYEGKVGLKISGKPTISKA